MRVSSPRPGCTTVWVGRENRPALIEAISLERSAAGRSAPPDPCASSVSPVNTAASAGAYQHRGRGRGGRVGGGRRRVRPLPVRAEQLRVGGGGAGPAGRGGGPPPRAGITHG